MKYHLLHTKTRGFYALMLLLFAVVLFAHTGCDHSPKDPKEQEEEQTQEEEKKKEEEEETPPPTHIQFFTPPLTFGSSVEQADFAGWAKKNGAKLLSQTPQRVEYEMPSDSVPRVALLIQDGIYVEALVKVKDHGVTRTEDFYQYITRRGMVAIKNEDFRYTTTGDAPFFLDIHAHDELWDISFYGAPKTTSMFLPFLRFDQDVSRKVLKQELAQQGFVFQDGTSSAYSLRFSTPFADLPSLSIHYDKQTERPIQSIIYPKHKSIVRSPHIVSFLQSQGFELHPYDLPVHRVLIHKTKEIRCDVAMPNPGSDETGLISFAHSPNPDKEVEIQSIDFPFFEFGKTREEIIALEEARGRTTQDFMGVLNVQTTDPYFVTHGYFFDSATGQMNMIVTNVKNNTIVASDQYKKLMSAAGFDYEGEDFGRYRFWHRTKPVVAVADSNTRPVTITYRPKPN